MPREVVIPPAGTFGQSRADTPSELNYGSGSPEGVYLGFATPTPSLYIDVTEGSAAVYVKTTGNGTRTGWEPAATEVPVSTDAADITFDPTGLDFFTESDVQAALVEADPVLAALTAATTTFTQTYSTADDTVSAATATAVDTDAATSTLPFGYTETQANQIVASVNALIDDNLQLRKLINALIDVLQAAGVVG